MLVSWTPPAKSAGAKLLASRKKKAGGYNPDDLFPSDPFGGRYTNPAKPAFTAEVKAGSNEVNLELKD